MFLHTFSCIQIHPQEQEDSNMTTELYTSVEQVMALSGSQIQHTRLIFTDKKER